MKKLFTPLLLFLMVLLGGINASAETATVPLTFDMWHVWDSAAANAEYASDDKDWWNNSGGWIHKVGEEFTNNGYLFKFFWANEGKFYANLTEYAGINGVATPGTKIKMVFNANLGAINESNPGIEATIDADETGNFEFSFDDLKNGDTPVKFVHVNTVEVNLPDGNTPCKVESINCIVKPDPKAIVKDMWHQWTGWGADATIIENGECDCIYNIGKEVGQQDMVIGPNSCNGDLYADFDITKYSGIEGLATPGITIRFYFNRQDLQGPGIDKYIDTNANGKFSINFSELGDVSFVHLNFVKIAATWQNGNTCKWPNGLEKAVVTSMKLVDPLEAAINKLDALIAKAKLYDEHFKTEESWSALQAAITAAETAVDAAGATEGSITEASENLAAALEGLTLQEGYEYLTAEMFKKYDSVNDPGEGTVVGCAYDIFKSIGMPYGDSGVGYLNWADLSKYDKLIVTSSDGKPRFCMNRTTSDGQEWNGGMLDMAPGNGNTSTGNYLTSDGNIVTIDLNKMVKECGFARLHSIKGLNNGNVFVTGMYLYKSNDPLEIPKDALTKEIEKAKNCDPFLKSQKTWDALQDAITAGETVLDEATTEKELTDATNAITAAIAGLKLEEGYSELTKDKFREHDAPEDTGEGRECNYHFELNGTGQPIGDWSITEKVWADLTKYDQLILTVSEGYPRICMNRKKSGGQEYESGQWVGDMLDMKEGNLSNQLYLHHDEGTNIYTVDLRQIIDDHGYARLHAVQNCVLTGIYLYTDPANKAGYNLTFNINNSNNVVIKVNDEIQTLPSNNVLNVPDRAVLTVSPASKFRLKSVTADGEDVALEKDGTFSKLIVKAISYDIETEDADPLEKPRVELQDAIDDANIYDGVAKTAESYKALTDAIAEGVRLMTSEDATVAKINATKTAIEDAIKGLTLDTEAGYSDLTIEIFKKYASVEEPGDGEATACAYKTFENALELYGDKNNDYLSWADLSDYDKLIVTVYGENGPCFFMNRTDKEGKQGETMAESTMIELNAKSPESWSSIYHSAEGNTYTVDLKKIVADYGYAHLHSIQNNEYEKQVFVTGMYLKKDATTNVDITFDIDDPEHVVIKVGEDVITGLADENTKALPFRGKLSIAPAEGFAIKSLTADGKEVTLNEDGEYITTILKDVTYKIVTVDPTIINLNFNVDDASHVVITKGDNEIINLVDGNNIEVEKDTKITIAAAEGFILSSVKAGEEEVELTDGVYTTTVTEPVNFTIVTKAEEPADPNALTGAWWKQWNGFGADATEVELAKDIVDNLGKEVKHDTVILGNPACDGDCYADLSEYGGVEGVATPGVTVRFYFNRTAEQGPGLDIRLSTDADGKFKYEFDELKDGENPVSFVHLVFVKIVGDGVVESIKVLPKPSEVEIAKKNLKKLIATASYYDDYAKTEESFKNLTDAIAAGNALLKDDATTADKVNDAIKAINDAISGFEYLPGYSVLKDVNYKNHSEADNLTETSNDPACSYVLNVSADTPYGDGSVGYLNWADLTNFDELIVTYVGDKKPRVMMNRLEHGRNEFETIDGENVYVGKMLEMKEGNDYPSTNSYLTPTDNGCVINLKKIVDDYGYAHLNAIKYPYGESGIVTGMYLYKDQNAAKQFDLTFDIDYADHVVVKVNDETKEVASNGTLKVADRAKLSIAPAADYVLSSVTANGEAVELKNGMVTKTIVKNISFKITTGDADPLQKPKDELTEIIENAKLYDKTAKTEDSFNALTEAIAKAEAELINEKADATSLESAGNAITAAIGGLTIDTAAGYSKLTTGMYKSHESLDNPVETDEDPGCADGLMTDTELPYGNKDNDILKWADLFDYDKLIITTDGNFGPQIFLNRLVANGQQAGTMEESKMIDINPNTAEAWSSKYLTVEDNEYNEIQGKKYTIDLKQILADYGFARLHSIKSNTYERSIFVTGMYLKKDPTTNVNLTFDINDPDQVVIKFDNKEITGLKIGENKQEVPFRGKLSIAPAEGYEIKSLTADDVEVALNEDGEYTTTILNDVIYKVVTIDPNAKESIKLNFKVDDASHVVIKAGETEIKDFSNDIEVEENTVLTIAPTEGFALKSITANGKEVALTDGKYTTTVTASVSYNITTEVETPVDPDLLTGAWWKQWNGFGADASVVETTKPIVDNLGKEVKHDTVILGNPACDGDCYADLSQYGGVEGTATPGTTVRFYFNRKDVQGAGIDIRLNTDSEGKFSYAFDELTDGGNPVSFVHLAFVKIVGNGAVDYIKVLPKPSEAALAKKNLEKELAKANLYDEYAKTADSFKKLTDAIADGNTALSNDAATAEEVNKAITAIQTAIAGLKLQEGYSDFTADMFKQYASVEDLGEGNAIQNVNFKLFETTDQPLGGGNISELEWADLTQYDKLIVTVKEGSPRILMNRLAFGAQEYEDGEYTGKFLDMTEGDDHYSTNRYLTVEGNAYTVDLAKMVDDFGFARLNALKFKGFGAKGMVNGLYLYYKDPTVKREYDLTFDIDDASHVVVNVNGETKQVASNGVLKVADRAKLTIAPAADYILTSATANDEAVELKNGMVTKTIVKNITYKITTDLADPFTEQKEALTAIIENAKLYDATAKTEDSFNALTDAIAEAEAELVNEKMSDESLKAAGDAVNEAIKGLELDANYYQLTPDMYKSHESLANPVETAEDPGCANGLMTATEVPYGNRNNDILKWADLSKYSKLIITTDGKYAPRFYFNRLEANGQQAATMEESKMIDINPATEAWSSEYLTVEGNKYTIDLRMLVKDNNRLARLHSIQSNTYEKGILVTGMYLYKEPQVAATEITLDKTEVSKLTFGETVKLTATVDPVDTTDAIFWSSSDDEVATVDENGNVTVVGVGNATITASCGEITADCDFECYPMFGDANWDGMIDVTDAVDIVNYVIEKKDDVPANDVEEWTKFYVAGANVNNDEDGKITFADASAAVKLALDQPVATSTQNRVAAAYDVESEDALVVGGISAADGRSFAAVTLDNTMEYVALQADIIIPEGMSVEVKEGRRVADSHIMATRKIADNHIRVALYNLGNTAFAENNAPIIEIIADGMIADNEEIAICNIIAADTDANRFVLASKAADTSRVEALGFDSNAPVKVYDLDGRHISDKVDNLEQGIYIFRQGNNAKKVRIR